MPMIFIESYEEWNKRHGGRNVLERNPVTAKKTGWRLWPDGAMCRDEDFGHRNEPPENEYELLRLQRNYFWSRHEIALANLNAFADATEAKLLMAQRYSNVPRPDNYDLQRLKNLQAIVAKEGESLKAAEAALYFTPEETEKRKRQQVREELEYKRYMELKQFQTDFRKLRTQATETEDIAATLAADDKVPNTSRTETHTIVGSKTDPTKFSAVPVIESTPESPAA